MALAFAGHSEQLPPAEYPRAFQPSPVLSVERAAAAVVRIEGRGGGSFSEGTGIGIAPNRILTASHLLDERSLFAIRCDTVPLAIESVVRDHATDVAVITVDGRPLAAVELAAHDPDPGTPLLFSGYPRGQALLVTVGRVESYDEDVPLMRFTPPPEVGQSGGALLDPDGRLVGMVTGVERAAGIGYAVPVSVLREVVEALAPGLKLPGSAAAPATRPRRPACP